MAGINLEANKLIYKSGQPITTLHMITGGSVAANYPGGFYTLGKGDVIGICEICSEVHFLEYQTLEDTEFLTYPMPNIAALTDLLQKRPDVAGLFTVSAFRQIHHLISQCDESEMKCNSMYRSIRNDYLTYNTLCGRYRLTPRELEGIDDVAAYMGEESADLWLTGYYLGLLNIFKNGGYKPFMKDPAVPLGLLRKASLDFRRTFYALEEHFQYQAVVSEFYFNEKYNDIFEYLTSLYFKMGKDSEDSKKLYTDINRIIQQAKENPCLDPELVKQRSESFLGNVSFIVGDQNDQLEHDTEAIMTELAGSLNTILDFAGMDLEASTSFHRHLNTFKALSDKSSTEDSVNALRRQLTRDFYTLYTLVFEKTLSAPSIPAPVRLFLYFGYVDEELAEKDNCILLYTIAESLKCKGASGVYTFYDWLLAIFYGEKEPSRNEFDQDFNEYINKQKVSGTISAAEFQALKTNNMGKVVYELQNMFPQVNKMTYGRVMTFCPIFMAENVMKDLPSTQVTTSSLGQALEKIRQIDYSAYYRETLDTKNLDSMGKQYIHVEYLPDFILMPNVGTRGVLWQEIEGRNRLSPSRMIFSIFHMEDLYTSLVRLTGSFRWEMCKRMQGVRWNDITERSLTSEYFDYVQFYRKNNDLSQEAKERIKLSLQKARNSFQEMFIRDYIVWVLFEGTGSPRMNPVARSIFLTYCPFPTDVAQKMRQSPMFTDLLDKRDVRIAKALYQLDVLEKKIMNEKKQVPDSLDKERAFIKGIVHS